MTTTPHGQAPEAQALSAAPATPTAEQQAALTAAPGVQPLSDGQIASACMSYRHDFGLLEPDERAKIMFTAREWERAFSKECEWTAPAQPAEGAANVAKPAEIEHVAGDVSKNGAESNMSTQQTAPAAGITVEQVEDAIGLQSTAWGTIDAKKIVEAVLRLANGQAPATQQAGERVYAFRRKGLADFCTCDEARYEELSNKPRLFETRIFYTTPQPTHAQAVAMPLDEARRLFDAGWKAAALFCDREDVVADGIIGFSACPQFEAAFSAAHGIKGGQHGTE